MTEGVNKIAQLGDVIKLCIKCRIRQGLVMSSTTFGSLLAYSYSAIPIDIVSSGFVCKARGNQTGQEYN